MLFDRNPIYTALADKLKARIYIATKLQNLHSATRGGDTGSKIERPFPDKQTILNPNSPLFAPIDSLSDLLFATNASAFLPKLYGIWKSIEEIDFITLPESFVLKTNHDCGGVVLVPHKGEFLANKRQFLKAMKKLKAHLKTNYYNVSREWHYKNIEPRVFAEELLQSCETKDKVPQDYKVHVFGGGEEVVMDMEIDRFTNHKTAMLTESWEKLPFELGNPSPQSTPPKPQNSDTMFEVAKRDWQGF